MMLVWKREGKRSSVKIGWEVGGTVLRDIKGKSKKEKERGRNKK